MPNFMLLLRQPPSKFNKLAPEEIQRITAKYIAWREDLVRRGRMCGGEKLGNEGGRHLRLQNDKVTVTDGPYSETNEVLGGYFTIAAADYAEAVDVARTCPHLTGTQWIEVRQVDEIE
jgi:hypothetical protein